MARRPFRTIPLWGVVSVVSFVLSLTTGCSSFTFKIKGTPASSIPNELRANSKRDLVPIAVTKFAQRPPARYLLAPGDTVGVSVDGIIPLRGIDDNPVATPLAIKPNKTQ